MLEHEGILLNTTACTVDYKGKRAELSKNENKILATLLEHAGEVVSRDAMMNRLWETDCFVEREYIIRQHRKASVKRWLPYASLISSKPRKESGT